MSNTKFVLAKLVTNPTPPFGKSNFALSAGRRTRIKLDDTVATYDGMIALLKEVFNIAGTNALRLFLFTEDEESGETSAVLTQAAKAFDDEIQFFRDNGSSNTIDLYAEEVASPSMASTSKWFCALERQWQEEGAFSGERGNCAWWLMM